MKPVDPRKLRGIAARLPQMRSPEAPTSDCTAEQELLEASVRRHRHGRITQIQCKQNLLARIGKQDGKKSHRTNSMSDPEEFSLARLEEMHGELSAVAYSAYVGEQASTLQLATIVTRTARQKDAQRNTWFWRHQLSASHQHTQGETECNDLSCGHCIAEREYQRTCSHKRLQLVGAPSQPGGVRQLQMFGNDRIQAETRTGRK